jgi:type I restriction-modification system DNA methylase subunit
MESIKALGQYYTPESISGFVAELTNDLPFKKVLDPACGSASLLLAVASRKEEAEVIGVDINQSMISQAESKLKKTLSRYQLINADFLSTSRDKLGSVDLVVCNPPIGRGVEKEVEGLKLRSAETAFILLSLELLKPEGYLIFVVPEGLLFNEAGRHFREHLVEKYSLEAIISLPSNTFHPFAGIKTSLLVIKKSKQVEKVFFAEYAEQQALKAIVSNFRQRTTNKNPSQGFWVEIENIRDAESVWVYSRFRSLKDFETKRASSRFPVRLLSELVTFGRNNSETAETIFIQRIGTQPKAILKGELPEKSRQQNYIECTVKEEAVLPHYLKWLCCTNE